MKIYSSLLSNYEFLNINLIKLYLGAKLYKNINFIDLFHKVNLYKEVRLGLDNNIKFLLNDNCTFKIGINWPLYKRTGVDFIIRNNATIIVNGKFSIYDRCNISVNSNATLELGSGYINNNSQIHCFNKIIIGDDVVISNNCIIRDSDNHKMRLKENMMSKPIMIGNHVWIGMGSMILKGVSIGNDAVIAAGSVVTRDVPDNCLAGGTPARILRDDVHWE